MSTRLHILLVEDSDSDADLLIRFLKRENIDFIHSRVWDKPSFITALHENNLDLIIADHSLPQFSGMEAFRIAKSENIRIPFILVTGTVTENVLIEYAKEGVDDYILKDNLLRLPSAIDHVLSKKKIEDLSKNLEIVLKDLNDSINYAKRIQNAMLPDTALLHDCFPESFIFFRPKDVLSGDFYWFKNDGNTFFAAAADCTGHGIPGALMSMIGIEKLNSSVLTTKLPSEILKQLNKNIVFALSQSNQYEHSFDGMDIALCSINIDTLILHFAGANRPLWIVRNNTIEEIKGTKQAIGGISTMLTPNFESIEIQLYKGDTFYMFSDGFADQFGGESDKKLLSKNFKQLLLSMQGLLMSEQEIHLLQFIETWKATTDQIDDILVIGIRIV